MINMTNYKFYDDITGEEFFVQANNQTTAIMVAHDYFEAPIYQGEYSDQEAEWLGLDTY